MGLINRVQVFSDKTVTKIRHFVSVVNYHKLISTCEGDSVSKLGYKISSYLLRRLSVNTFTIQ